MQKLYCYVDETGQDTKGQLFIIAIIISGSEQLEEVERKLIEIENSSKKRSLKWKKTHYKVKEVYLQALTNLEELKGNIFYAIYSNMRDYIRLTSYAIADAIIERARGEYIVTVAIDGISPKSALEVANVLKERRIRYRKVRGVRDESNAWIRLADAIAGFIRDAHENKAYAQRIYAYFRQQGFLREIKNAGVSGSSYPA